LTKGRLDAKELKRDPLMEQYITASSWIKSQSRTLLTVFTVAAVIIVAVLLFLVISSRRSRAASDSLGEAFKVAEATVANPVPAVVNGYAFTSEDEKARKAYEAFNKTAHDYPSYYGDFAKFYAATYQLKFDAPAAEATLKELAQKNSEISAQAKLALAQRYEGSGRLDESLATLQDLLKQPGDLSTLLVRFNIARVYEAQGKTKEATDEYFGVAKDAKSVGIGTSALTRLSVLDPARVEQLPPPEPSNPLAGLR
jgi:tetratricopeptide (TPR) repeat protein